MKRYKLGIFAFLWLAIGSIGFAALWVRTPALWQITWPDSVWTFLQHSLNATCCESMANVEFLGALGLGLLVSAASLLLVCLAKKVCSTR